MRRTFHKTTHRDKDEPRPRLKKGATHRVAPALKLPPEDHERDPGAGWSTAEGVAEKTGRGRTTESDYLNQLKRMGLVKRRWQGRTVRFSPSAPREMVLKVVKLLGKRGYSEKAINEIIKGYL